MQLPYFDNTLNRNTDLSSNSTTSSGSPVTPAYTDSVVPEFNATSTRSKATKKTNSPKSIKTSQIAVTPSQTVQNADRVDTFRYAYNESGKDKKWTDEILTVEFKDTVGDLNSVMEHVKTGHALCAGNLNGKRRKKENFAGSQWILIDIDNSGVQLDENGVAIKDAEKIYKPELTIDEARNHEFINAHCALIYTTFSHTEEWHKFRLVFLLPEFVTDSKIYEAAIVHLMRRFPADPSCKDCIRAFYGATNASFPLINPDVSLPSNFVAEAKLEADRLEVEKQNRLAERKARQASFQSRVGKNSGEWDPDTLIQNALSWIPERVVGGNNYDQCLKVLQALHSHYGDAGISIAESWSPSQPGTTWDIPYKFNSFKGSGIAIGTLYWIAQKYGFVHPSGFKNDSSTETISVTSEEILNHKPTEENRFTWDMVEEGFPADITEAYHKANDYQVIEADVVAVSIVTVLSSELGGLCDTDTDSPLNINAIIVGPSGSGKSPKMESVVGGLYEIDEQRHQDFVTEELNYKRDIEDYENRKKSMKDKGTFDEDEPIKPTENHTIIQGITGECLVQMLATQKEKGRGLLGYYDEFVTYIGSLDKYNKSGDERSRSLSIYSGALTRISTKSGGTLRVQKPRMSIIGGIQPVVLMKEVNRTGNQDGWWARYLLAKTYKSKTVKRFDRNEVKAKHLKNIVEKYVSKIQSISGRIRSEMTEDTIDLRVIVSQKYCDEVDIAVNEEAHLKTIDQVDRIATVLSLLEYLHLGLGGDLAPVFPHHYRAALAICENSLALWEELASVDTEQAEVELVKKAYKLGQKKKKLDAKILQNWATGQRAQNVIRLVHETFGGNLTTSRSNTLVWTP